MSLSESERARVLEEIARITQEDYKQSFEGIYELAHRVMGEYPDLAAREILNFNNHTARAPSADSYEKAIEILQQGRRHIIYGSYISLYQIMLYRNDYSDSYICEGERQHKRSLLDFRQEDAKLKKLCLEIPKIEIKRESDPKLIATDIDRLLEANKMLLIVSSQIVEFQARMADVLHVEGRFASAIRRMRQLIWKDIFFLGSLAVTFNLIAAIIYGLYQDEILMTANWLSSIVIPVAKHIWTRNTGASRCRHPAPASSIPTAPLPSFFRPSRTVRRLCGCKC